MLDSKPQAPSGSEFAPGPEFIPGLVGPLSSIDSYTGRPRSFRVTRCRPTSKACAVLDVRSVWS